MNKILILLITVLFSCVAFSNETPVLGVAMNFDCPHCKKVFESRGILETHCSGGLKKKSCRLSFLPFPNDINDYRSKAFYIAKTKSNELALEVADIFYGYDPKGALSKEEVLTLLSTLSPKNNWGSMFSGKPEQEGSQSLYKVAELFKLLKITDTPTFIWVTSDDAKVIPTAHNPNKRLDSVIEFLGTIR